MRRFFSFRHWPILPKIMTISLFSIAVTGAVAVLYLEPRIHQRLLEGKKEGVKNVVDVAFGVFHEYDALARTGQLTLAEAQARVIEKLRNSRYGEKEYFWINDVSMRMIMHPMRELEGQDLSDNRDPNGKYLFREFVRVCSSSGAGIVDYMWPKPGERRPVSKISYVRIYEPWGWILGSGIYVDDVEKEMERLRSVLLVGTLVFSVVTVGFTAFVGAGITRPLKKVIDGLQDIARGKGDIGLNKRIAITSIDEIGLLSSEFNSVMESIGCLTAFKKVIDEDDSVEDVYRRLGEVFSDQLGLRGSRIHAVISDENKLARIYPAEAAPGEMPCDPEVEESCDRCKAKRTGHAISSLTYPGICRSFRGGANQQHCCFPLVIGGGTVAIVQIVFEVGEAGSGAKEAEQKLFKVEQYIKEALPVIETKRLMSTLKQASLRDAMTGLHNRRYLQECMNTVVAGAMRRGKKIGLLMCDLDHFKRVNDTHGHNSGDVVLKEIAGVLTRSVRESDVVVRFGGEEFLVVLLDIGRDEVVQVAEKIRQSLQRARIEIESGAITITASLGAAEFPTDGNTLWECIKRADGALYEAKAGGRNKTVRFGGSARPDQRPGLQERAFDDKPDRASDPGAIASTAPQPANVATAG
jgi:diguanylate cyclase (GGDEF)-like protein